MQSLRATRSTVLGKRSQRTESQTAECQLNTPEPSPALKRPRTLSTSLDGDHNKENIPPTDLPDISSLSARETRALRRTSTETSIASPTGSPTRPRTALRRASTASAIIPASPTKAVAQLSISTPPSTPRRPQAIHSQARTLLRSTCSEAADMVGREEEREILREFLDSLMKPDGKPSSSKALYISGSPGCGKTALVTAILEELSSTHADINTVLINCMTLPNVEALLDRLTEDFSPTTKGSSPRKGKGKKAIASTSVPCILVLDELDHIASDSQSLNKVFAALNSQLSNMRVIAIANTHTLTSQTHALPTESNITTLHFSPYKDSQLLKIVQARLAPLHIGPSAAAAKEFFPTPALMLLTKKVAAVTGDVRTLFEVLRGAVDMAVKKAGNVTPDVIIAAFKAHAPTTSRTPAGGNEMISKVQNQPMQARLVLLSLVLALKRLESNLPLSSGASVLPSPIKRARSTQAVVASSLSIDKSAFHTFYSSILGRSEILSPVSRSDLDDLLNVLEGHGLVVLSTSVGSPSKTGRRALGRSSSFGGLGKQSSAHDIKLGDGVRVEEVLRALRVSEATEDIQEEELREIWDRENKKILKEVKAAELKAQRESGAKFVDAMED